MKNLMMTYFGIKGQQFEEFINRVKELPNS